MNYKNYFKYMSAGFLLAFFFIPNVNAHENGHLVRITEAMSSSGGVIGDWFEITNLDTTAVDMTGWKMDDSTAALALAAPLQGIATIAPGQTVVYLEVEEPTALAEIATFKEFWGPNATNMVVGYCAKLNVTLSSKGDTIVLFNATGVEATRTTFGAATVGSSFYWGYNNEGSLRESGVSVEGTIMGTMANQVTYKSTHTLGNIASPGTAIVYSLLSEVDKITVSDLKVFPNPFTNQIYLNGSETISNVTVTNIMGQRMLLNNMGSERKLNTDKLSSGVYFMSVELMNGKKQEFKLVKR